MTPDDLDNMTALLGDPQVMRYYPQPKSRQEALAWIAWNQRLYREHGFRLWLLTLRTTEEFVGDCLAAGPAPAHRALPAAWLPARVH
jgi:RimJ/RimL family protein N-acetyltransferase